jgi:hypothetical protein
MSYELRFEQKPTYLHAVVTGTNSKETVAAYLDDIQRECVARNCCVLIEERWERASASWTCSNRSGRKSAHRRNSGPCVQRRERRR